MAACDISALHCPASQPPPTSSHKTIITDWTIERDLIDNRRAHPCFDSKSGCYNVPVDGLYKIFVEIIPLGSPLLLNDKKNRRFVPYAICLQELAEDHEDHIQRCYHDIGTKFAKVEHLKAGTQITCVRMPNIPGDECLRIKVEIIIRKRKRDERQLTKKEKRERKKHQKRHAIARRHALLPTRGRPDASALHSNDYLQNASDDGSESDSEWEHGFESDSTSEEEPTSRLAKRFKRSHPTDYEDPNGSAELFDVNDEVIN